MRALTPALTLIGLVALVFSLFSQARLQVEWSLSPYLFPALAGAGLFIMGLALILRKNPEEEAAPHGPRLWLSLLLLLAYGVLLPYVGFLLATTAFILVFQRILGERRWLKPVLFSLAASVLLLLLFVEGLGVRLPAGVELWR